MEDDCIYIIAHAHGKALGVDITLVQTSFAVQTGAWISVIGYLVLRDNYLLEAILIWDSTGINLQEYQRLQSGL